MKIMWCITFILLLGALYFQVLIRVENRIEDKERTLIFLRALKNGIHTHSYY